MRKATASSHERTATMCSCTIPRFQDPDSGRSAKGRLWSSMSWMGRRASRPPTSAWGQRRKSAFCSEPVRPPGGVSPGGRILFGVGGANGTLEVVFALVAESAGVSGLANGALEDELADGEARGHQERHRAEVAEVRAPPVG